MWNLGTRLSVFLHPQVLNQCFLLLGPGPHVDSTLDSVGRLTKLLFRLVELGSGKVVVGRLAGVGAVNQPRGGEGRRGEGRGGEGRGGEGRGGEGRGGEGRGGEEKREKEREGEGKEQYM